MTDEELAQCKIDREQIARETAEKLADPNLWKGCDGLHELVLLRLSWQMHVEECDRRIAERVTHLHDFLDASWAEIGKVLGVSKQAAQKRYGG